VANTTDTASKSGRPRGRPKLPWGPFDDELHRRCQNGEALPTLEAEAKYLAGWGKAKNLRVEDGGPIGVARIRERIKKRLNGGAQAYKNAREFIRQEFLRKQT
jgi:hypothetical protein